MSVWSYLALSLSEGWKEVGTEGKEPPKCEAHEPSPGPEGPGMPESPGARRRS